jgi:hypothetical protein
MPHKEIRDHLKVTHILGYNLETKMQSSRAYQ